MLLVGSMDGYFAQRYTVVDIWNMRRQNICIHEYIYVLIKAHLKHGFDKIINVLINADLHPALPYMICAILLLPRLVY